MAEIDEIRLALRWLRRLRFVAIAAWLTTAFFIAWSVLAPAETETAQWYDKRETSAALALFTALVVTIIWVARRTFGPPGRWRTTSWVITLAVAALWPLTLLTSALGGHGAWAWLPGGITICAIATALGATARWGSLKATMSMLAGNWLAVGSVCLFVMIKFVVAPPATADLCSGGMDCIGHGGPNETIGLFCLFFVVTTCVFAVLQFFAIAAGSMVSSMVALSRRRRDETMTPSGSAPS